MGVSGEVGRIEEVLALVRDTLQKAPYENGQASSRALRAYVEQVRGMETGRPFVVRVKQFNYPPDIVRGLVERSTDGAVIRVSSSLNTCWMRFVVMKELMHLLVDDAGSYTHDPVQQLDLALGNLRDARALNSEDYAFCAAMEYSFAHVLRPRPTIESSLAVATQFRIPQKVVEAYYDGDWSHWSPWGSISHEINTNLG